MTKTILGGGAILDGILIAATQYLNLPSELHYLWAILAVVWGIIILNQRG